MRRALALLTILSLVPPALALDPLGLQDDAATGGDAPDAHAEAVALAGGTYAGSMDSALDAQDWYRVGPLVGQRMRVEAHATSGTIFLQVRDDAGAEVWQGLTTGNTLFYLGALGGSYRFGFIADEGSVDAAYSFRLDLVTPPVQNDAGILGDAGDVDSAARGIAAGTFSGLLHPFSGDGRDWFGSSAPAGKRVTATLSVPAGTSARIVFATASGFHVASATATGGAASVTWGAGATRILVDTGGQDAVAYTLALSFADPPAQNDAGLGGDAPASRELAPLLAPGTHSGLAEAHAGDVDDSYRFVAPAGHALYASLSVCLGEAYLRAFDAAGAQVAEVWVSPAWSQSISLPAGTYALTVGGTSAPAFTQYSLHVDAVAFGAVGFVSLTVDEDAPDPDHPTIRNIRLVVENLGAGAYDGALAVVIYNHAGSQYLDYSELLLDYDFVLAPWETREVIVPWDTTTFVGDFEIQALASNSGENAEIRTHVSAPVDPELGFGVGYDLTWIRDLVD